MINNGLRLFRLEDWMSNNKCLVSVKMTYWFFKHVSGVMIPESLNTLFYQKFRIEIYSLKICSRFNIWLWGTIRDKLLICLNLAWRRLNHILFCSFCVNQLKFLKHILFFSVVCLYLSGLSYTIHIFLPRLTGKLVEFIQTQ